MIRMSLLEGMATFAAVVRTGGFTAAARDLGLSKQTVSDQIAKLEERLGVRLLERTTRRVRPTEDGARYYDHCAAIVERAEEAVRELQDRSTEPTGLLRIASTVTFYPAYFLTLLGIAKGAGALVLILPGTPEWLKNWVYGGVVIELLSAFYSYHAAGEDFVESLPPLAFLAVALTSFVSGQRTRALRQL